MTSATRRSKCVLIVEDDASFRSILRQFFDAREWSSLESSRISQARQLLAEHEPSLLIVDGLLPDGKGTDFIEEARRSGFEGSIVFISHFWKDVGTFRTMEVEHHVAKVLSKPIDPERLTKQLDLICRSLGDTASDLDVESFTKEFAVLAAKYREDLPDMLTETLSLLEAEQRGSSPATLDHLRSRLHSIVGTSGTFGIVEAQDLLQSAEAELGQLTAANSAQDRERLLTATRLVREALNSLG